MSRRRRTFVPEPDRAALGAYRAGVTSIAELSRAVEAAFATTAAGLARWPRPHPDRAPLEEEYSRVTDPGRWRIVGAVPPCGCDACDDGSDQALDLLDEILTGIVSGGFRHLRRGSRTIVAQGPTGWSASGDFADGEVERVLADPTGWQEVRGTSWC